MDASSCLRQLVGRYDPALRTLYSLHVLPTSGRELEFVFSQAADRDALYQQLLAVLAPVTTFVVEAAQVQRRPPDFDLAAAEQQRQREERSKQITAEIRQELQRKAEVLQRPGSAANKSPRTPTTRKPRE